MKIQFYKYQGTGNDFVIVDNRDKNFPSEDVSLIAKICDRKFGVGADGLMLLENDATTDFKMIYYNADGNESSMCGNGGRCISAFARFLNVFENKASFTAIDGLHEVYYENGLYHLKMIDVDAYAKDGNDTVLDTGSPHYVSFVENLQQMDVLRAGADIRYNDVYRKDGINVNFATVNEDGIEVRTYERGVENETLSCGTGVTAVAIAAHANGLYKRNPVPLKVGGGRLQIRFETANNTYQNIWLIGPAEQVFSGQMSI